MAAVAAQRMLNGRATSLLRLPPGLRPALYRPSVRQFHASSPRSSSLEYLDLEVLGTSLLTGLHATGLTWAVVIPVSAVLVRAVTIALFSYPARRAVQRTALLGPVFAGINFVQGGKGYGDKKEKQTVFNSVRETWAVERWRAYVPLLQFPFFLAMVEAIRKLSGARQGLWAWLRDFTGSVFHWNSGPSVPITETPLDDSAALSPIETPNMVDTSLTTEGPWWCTDLTVADPTNFLPIAVPVVMMCSIGLSMFGRPTDNGPAYQQKMGTKKGGLGETIGRTLLILCGGMFFVTPHLPAGLLWYWLWSSSLTLLNHVYNDYWMPVKRYPTAVMGYMEDRTKNMKWN
jgi:mitochondrial inner membrane protein COX18